MVREETVATITGAPGICCGLAACTELRPEQPASSRTPASAQMENNFMFML
jgi:hypothetical protein